MSDNQSGEEERQRRMERAKDVVTKLVKRTITKEGKGGSTVIRKVTIGAEKSRGSGVRKEESWEYLDDFGKVRGPFLLSTIMHWIHGGFFDQRGDVPFRKSNSKSDFVPLLDVLNILCGDECEILRPRLRPKTGKGEKPKEGAPDPFIQEMRIPLDLMVLPSDSKFLSHYQNLEDCPTDVLLIILPPLFLVNNETLKPFTDVLGGSGVSDSNSVTIYCDDEEIFPEKTRLALVDWWRNQEGNELRPSFTKGPVLIFPAHSFVLATSSPVLGRAIAHQKTVHQSKNDKVPIFVRSTHPEAMRLILKRLYGNTSIFRAIEPSLLAFVFQECLRLQLSSALIRETRFELAASCYVVEDWINIATLAECLRNWPLFKEYSDLLSESAFFVFKGSRYLKLGPLALRRLLANRATAASAEAQLFVAAHFWLEAARRAGRLRGDDFWNLLSWEQQEDAAAAAGLSAEAKKEHRKEGREFRPHLDELCGEAPPRPPGMARSALAPDSSEKQSTYSLESSNRLFILSALRYAEMSVHELEEIRLFVATDSLLVDGVIQKLRSHQRVGREPDTWSRRYRPWKTNVAFQAEPVGGDGLTFTKDTATNATMSKTASHRREDFCQSAEFPTLLIRKGNDNVARLARHSSWAVRARRVYVRRKLGDLYGRGSGVEAMLGRQTEDVPHPPREVEGTSAVAGPDSTSYWAWSAGDPRLVSEATWAFEVVASQSGRLSIGVASALGVPALRTPDPPTVRLPKIDVVLSDKKHVSSDSVWYFNWNSAEFYAGVIGRDCRNVNFRISETPRFQMPKDKPQPGDLLGVRVKVGLSTLKVSVSLIEGKCCREGKHQGQEHRWLGHTFGHRLPQQTSQDSSGYHRPVLWLRPWFEMADPGDALALPVLRTDTGLPTYTQDGSS